VSYQVYRLTEGGDEYFLSLLEEVEERCWESIDDMDKDFLSMLSETQIKELTEAINKHHEN
jgi:DNA-binding PadR family transcriptional regulator